MDLLLATLIFFSLLRLGLFQQADFACCLAAARVLGAVFGYFLKAGERGSSAVPFAELQRVASAVVPPPPARFVLSAPQEFLRVTMTRE
jgi:hypothetical protein